MADDLPYMQFFPADWLADCDVLSMSSRGAWQTFLCKAWQARSASVTLKIAQWSRVFGATNAEQAERAIAEIEECEIGDVIREDDGRVTLVSRRIERDLAAMGATQKKRSEAARIAAEKRWEAERKRKASEAGPDGMRVACESHATGNADAMRNDAIPEARSQKPSSPPIGGKSRGEKSPPLPHGEPFAKAWAKWVKHRSEIRKPLKPTQIESQLKNLGAMTEADAVSMIEHTIGMGWQGLREPETKAAPRHRSEREHTSSSLTAPDL